MSRRDTIIIAVLLNAGLLIVLFATSLKSDKVEDELPAITVLSSTQSEEKEVAAAAPAPFGPADQIDPAHLDKVIEQYVTPQVAATTVDQNSNLMTDSAAPVQEPVQEAPSQVSFKEVKVKKGDVLERIARQNHVSVSELMKTNNLTSTRLKIGQVLKIPASSGVSKAASTSTVASSDAQYYTIKAGDNPWTIAVKHRMKVDELLKLNNMDEQKARRLKAGDKLRVK